MYVYNVYKQILNNISDLNSKTSKFKCNNAILNIKVYIETQSVSLHLIAFLLFIFLLSLGSTVCWWYSKEYYMSVLLFVLHSSLLMFPSSEHSCTLVRGRRGGYIETESGFFSWTSFLWQTEILITVLWNVSIYFVRYR
jgi:hypothetical protein